MMKVSQTKAKQMQTHMENTLKKFQEGQDMMVKFFK